MKNALVYAYIGDAVYELYIRKYLVDKNISHVKDLQKSSLEFVSASSQRKHLEKLINNNLLTEEEIDLVKYGRNSKGTRSKSTDIITYRYATGLETLIGYLYLNNNTQRINEIMKNIVGE